MIKKSMPVYNGADLKFEHLDPQSIKNIVHDLKAGVIVYSFGKAVHWDDLLPDQQKILEKYVKLPPRQAIHYRYNQEKHTVEKITGVHSVIHAYLKNANCEASKKPDFFKGTKYRLPTKDELLDINACEQSAEDLTSGFGYAIVGRGIMGDQEKGTIIQSIQQLCDISPKNAEYKKALARAKNIELHHSKKFDMVRPLSASEPKGKIKIASVSSLITKIANGWPKKLEEGRFTTYCKQQGFSGPCKACSDKAMESSDPSVRGMASFFVNTVLKQRKKEE